MRQDRRFKEGEAVTSSYFARLMSNSFDWLLTVEPHLHRHASLDEIYAIPSKLVHAGSALSRWIVSKVGEPLIVGPVCDRKDRGTLAGQLFGWDLDDILLEVISPLRTPAAPRSPSGG